MVGFFPQDVYATNEVIGLRNRVMNGSMRIDQRNVGTAVSLNAAAAYVIDRWNCNNGLSMTSTFQQGVLGGSGFPPRISNNASTNCLTWVNSSTASTSTASAISITTHLEGNTLVDLGWGYTGAKTITLSFWVYASVIGVYSAALQNNDASMNYIATYPVSSTNNWQKVVLVITGPPSGTWTTDITTGINLVFNLHGSTATGSNSSVNSWQTSGYIASTQTNLALTASSTFSLTNVQLEIGTLATMFEWRPFAFELIQCQRYYEKSPAYTSPYLTSDVLNCVVSPTSGGYYGIGPRFTVEKRTVPTVRVWNPQGTPSSGSVNQLENSNTYAVTSRFIGTKGFQTVYSSTGALPTAPVQYHYDASSDY